MNPWLNIPAQDYIDHMEHACVAQGALLRRHLADCVARTSARSLLFLGAGIGNGLQSDVIFELDDILAVDINPEYLSILKERNASLPVRTICCNFPDEFFDPAQFDLVYGALLFEYVDLREALRSVRPNLSKNGRLIALLQQASDKGNVTETGIASLNCLSSAMAIIPPTQFVDTARDNGYQALSQRQLTQMSKLFVEVELKLRQ